eukprot:scaffold22155_cov101-Isochrysis_galbana.AAC.2
MEPPPSPCLSLPDLLSVHPPRKLMAEFEKLKGVKKPADAAKALASTRAALAEYLDGVELPPLGDARYDEDVAV